MKPEWKDAPEWAKFRAKSSLGDWIWFENEPMLTRQAVFAEMWSSPCGGLVEYAHIEGTPIGTLEKRPE